MDNFPEVAAKIVDDYMERLALQLRRVPAREREEFLLEIRSHIYEAYRQPSVEDDVSKILAVLRKLGEPVDVVSDRLPEAMVRSGTKRNLPLYVASGLLIALFGIPLGFGGVAVVVGVLAALAGILVAYYAASGVMLLSGAIVMLLGLNRIAQPEFWDRLVMLGFIHIDGPAAELLELLSPAGQGFLIMLFGSVFAAAGFGMLWLGRYLLRGLRFLYSLVLDWIRQLARSARRIMSEEKPAVPFLNKVFGKMGT